MQWVVFFGSFFFRCQWVWRGFCILQMVLFMDLFFIIILRIILRILFILLGILMMFFFRIIFFFLILMLVFFSFLLIFGVVFFLFLLVLMMLLIMNGLMLKFFLFRIFFVQGLSRIILLMLFFLRNFEVGFLQVVILFSGLWNIFLNFLFVQVMVSLFFVKQFFKRLQFWFIWRQILFFFFWVCLFQWQRLIMKYGQFGSFFFSFLGVRMGLNFFFMQRGVQVQ